MKTSEGLIVLQALVSMSESGKALPLKFSYAAARNRRKLGDLLQAYTPTRNTLIEKHAKRNEDGSMVFKKDSTTEIELLDAAAFYAADKALNDTEIEGLVLYTIPLDEFPSDIEIPVMEALMPMVKEETQ